MNEGNTMVVPIVSMIGLSLGLLTWGSVNLVAGWSSGTFGLFGLHVETVNIPWLNYLGVGLAVVAIAIYAFVKPNTSNNQTTQGYEAISSDPNEPINYDVFTALNSGSASDNIPAPSVFDRMSEIQKKLAGFALSILSGVCYGFNYDPVQYIQDHPEKFQNVSKDGLDYCFSHFTGIFLMSTTIFIGYIIVKKNNPWVNNRSILPSMISGAMWAVAQASKNNKR